MKKYLFLILLSIIFFIPNLSYADTFGYESEGGSGSNLSSNDLVGARFDANGNETVDSITSYVRATGSSCRYIKGVMVLSSSMTIITNGVADATGCFTNGSGTHWRTTSYSTSPTIVDKTEYLISWVQEINIVEIYWDSGSTNQGHIDSTNNFSDPANPDGSDDNNVYSIYATYTSTDVDPTATTGVATSTGQTSVSLFGTIDVGTYAGEDAYFHYGTATSSYATSSTETLNASSTVYIEQAGLTTLTPYYYRAGYATSSYGSWMLVTPADVATTTQLADQWNAGTLSSMQTSDNAIILDISGATVEDVDANSYCSVEETNDYFWIDRVVFEDIDNTTGEDGVNGYVDHTDHTTTVTPDESPSISVYSGNETIGSYNNCVLVWIDWDKDYTLTDETPVDLGCDIEPATHSGNIDIPSDFATSTLMRIYLNYNIDPSGPCTNESYAEIEDYSIGNAPPATTGTWTSTSTDLSSITNVDTSVIDCSTTTPANTALSLYTGINSSAGGAPTSWDLVTNCGGTIPNATGDLSSNYLWSKIIATSTNGVANVTVDWLTYGINQSAAAPPAKAIKKQDVFWFN